MHSISRKTFFNFTVEKIQIPNLFNRGCCLTSGFEEKLTRLLIFFADKKAPYHRKKKIARLVEAVKYIVCVKLHSLPSQKEGFNRKKEAEG